jgi:pimeloyl-ACP methyl ester carboxylesterase
MPELEVPGARLAYRSQGSGQPLVLVHGSATDLRTWDGVVEPLAAEHQVITYDRRGYGLSTHRPVRDHRVHGRDLEAILEQVAIVPATVVGWSSGGNIALALAARRPELFASVIVVEAPFHGLRHADRAVLSTLVRLKSLQLRGRRREAAEVFLRFGSALRSGGNGYDRAEPEARQVLLENFEPVLAEWDPHPFGVMHEHVSLRSVAALPMPLTWLLGGEGSPWMAKLADRVAARRPDLQPVVVPGAGHLLHLDRPAEFVAAVLAGVAHPDRTLGR